MIHETLFDRNIILKVVLLNIESLVLLKGLYCPGSCVTDQAALPLQYRPATLHSLQAVCHLLPLMMIKKSLPSKITTLPTNCILCPLFHSLPRPPLSLPRPPPSLLSLLCFQGLWQLQGSILHLKCTCSDGRNRYFVYNCCLSLSCHSKCN